VAALASSARQRAQRCQLGGGWRGATSAPRVLECLLAAMTRVAMLHRRQRERQQRGRRWGALNRPIWKLRHCGGGDDRRRGRRRSPHTTKTCSLRPRRDAPRRALQLRPTWAYPESHEREGTLHCGSCDAPGF
jgi:hypothetical protein